jgi:hypothetical protein
MCLLSLKKSKNTEYMTQWHKILEIVTLLKKIELGTKIDLTAS